MQHIAVAVQACARAARRDAGRTPGDLRVFHRSMQRLPRRGRLVIGADHFGQLVLQHRAIGLRGLVQLRLCRPQGGRTGARVEQAPGQRYRHHIVANPVLAQPRAAPLRRTPGAQRDAGIIGRTRQPDLGRPRLDPRPTLAQGRAVAQRQVDRLEQGQVVEPIRRRRTRPRDGRRRLALERGRRCQAIARPHPASHAQREPGPQRQRQGPAASPDLHRGHASAPPGFRRHAAPPG
ncbi:Uncharacterised protein [Bordetella pertussis]|nr:Uncharacterised protein [Bordetella pertussis]CFM32401.1 Uncharacterised protein [Bordetella pertussis]CFM67582.1 Uncharacterised protein [Bordetella pertussis]CFN05360.1 Uncharacterised protein [Bordetella pertussis]CFN84135.1 Uncharacterised protein [Bordetella pertussis]